MIFSFAGNANELENINHAVERATTLTKQSSGLMKAILASVHNNNPDQNNTEKAFPSKRNTQGDYLPPNDRDYLPKRGYGERYPDGRTASDRIYDRPEGRGYYGDDRSYNRDLEASRDYHKEESLRDRASLHEEGRQYETDRYPQGRRNHMLNDNSSLRQHNDRTHIVDEIRHDTKIYKSDERMDSDHRSRNHMRGSQYEVNERRRSGGESNDRKYNIDPSCMDKPLVININSECAAPSKGRFVHKFVIKPQSQTPTQNYPQQDPYKTMTSYQSPSSYMSRQHVGSSLYGAYY